MANQQVTITGALDVTSDVDIGSGKFVVTASDGSLAIATDKFTVAGASGDTLIAGSHGGHHAVEHAGCGGRLGHWARKFVVTAE